MKNRRDQENTRKKARGGDLVYQLICIGRVDERGAIIQLLNLELVVSMC